MGDLHHFEAVFRDFASIDREAGMVRGVSVITEGEARGHGLKIDAVTLAQVMQCAQGYKGGLKVKMSHDGDAGDIVGFLTAFRIEGGKLLADLNLLQSSQSREYVLELAEKIPDTFGLSIAFSGPTEERDGAVYARCTEIYSADLVSEPAANPSGLFERKTFTGEGQPPAPQPEPTQKMEEDKIKEIVNAALAAALEPLSARLSKLETPEVKPAAEDEELKKDDSTVAELAAKSALKLFTEQFGLPPSAASAPKDTEPTAPAKKTFEQLVAEKAVELKSKVAAIKHCAAHNAEEYADYNRRVRSGEIITL